MNKDATHTIPLAERMRPQSLDDYVGQAHLVAPDAPLFVQLSQGHVPSMILWGPPGTGKTTLAQLVSKRLNRPFFSISAVESGLKEVRNVLDQAQKKPGLFDHTAPILFIDEIHRFNKVQQDALLHAIEKGSITLIGATTENPGFEVINALRSRCQIVTLQLLTQDELLFIVTKALKEDVVMQKLKPKLVESDALIAYSGGDARKLLNLLELCVLSSPDTRVSITNSWVEKCALGTLGGYDKNGDYHYDVISAFIKSVRGSDPQAALLWLAKMLVSGEDITFIARRLLILASEDIGLANPNALVLANATMQAVQTVGMPEARIILSECTLYLANSPKSNSAYMAINEAMDWVRQNPDIVVPLSLRNAPVQLMKDSGYGVGYQYSHLGKHHFVYQEFMPKGSENKVFYKPTTNGHEERVTRSLQQLWGNKYDLEQQKTSSDCDESEEEL